MFSKIFVCVLVMFLCCFAWFSFVCMISYVLLWFSLWFCMICLWFFALFSCVLWLSYVVLWFALDSARCYYVCVWFVLCYYDLPLTLHDVIMCVYGFLCVLMILLWLCMILLGFFMIFNVVLWLSFDCVCVSYVFVWCYCVMFFFCCLHYFLCVGFSCCYNGFFVLILHDFLWLYDFLCIIKIVIWFCMCFSCFFVWFFCCLLWLCYGVAWFERVFVCILHVLSYVSYEFALFSVVV